MAFRSLRDRLLEVLPPERTWRAAFPEWEPGNNVTCPWHADHDASLSLDQATGAYHCFGCGQGGPDVVSFIIKRYHGDDFATGLAALAKQHLEGRDTLAKRRSEAVKKCRAAARAAPGWLASVCRTRGWTQETFTVLGLGKAGGRVAIPVEVDGAIEQVLLYDALKAEPDKPKMLNAWKGAKAGHLWPQHCIGQRPDPVVFLEGEPDVVLAWSSGLNAFTFTGGAANYRKAASSCDLSWIRGRVVVVCLDADQAGRKASHELVAALRQWEPASIRRLEVPKGKDLTEWFVGHGGTLADFVALCNRTEVAWRHEVVKASLEDASKAAHQDHAVSAHVVVAGKHLTPLECPDRVRAQCRPKKSEGHCSDCPARNGAHEFKVDPKDPRSVLWVLEPEARWPDVAKRVLEVSRRCPLEVEALSMRRVEKLAIVAAHTRATFADDSGAARREAFAFVEGLKAGQHYQVRMRSIGHPKTHDVLHVIDEAKGVADELRDFALSDERAAAIRRMVASVGGFPGQAVPGDSAERAVAAMLKRRAAVLRDTVTNIYGRTDLHVLLDLCWHSVRELRLGGETEPVKGTLDVLVVGDTRTGKGQTAQRMLRHYDLGRIVNGENATFAGLVGGIHAVGADRQLMWGAVVLEHGRLVVVDEFTGLGEHVMRNMSRIRSEGRAEIHKGGYQEEAPAVVRLVWISNPKDGAPMSHYAHGVEAITDLIGAKEDVARFDAALCVTTDEVPSAEINRIPPAVAAPDGWTREACRDLVLWTWSRSADQVRFEDGAAERAVMHAAALSARYSVEVPLLHVGNARYKVARIAAAAAALCFSTVDQVNLRVLPCHVDAAAGFLRWIYDKGACAFDRLSGVQAERQVVDLTTLTRWFGEQAPDVRKELVNGLLEFPRVTVEDLKTALRSRDTDAQVVLQLLASAHALKRVGQGIYVKRPAFSKLLHELKER